jgi:hypothetical protein
MPLADTSQTTRTQQLAGREMAKFHRLNPYAPQGGRYTFSQGRYVYEVVAQTVTGIPVSGQTSNGCCTTTTAPSTTVSGGGGAGT